MVYTVEEPLIKLEEVSLSFQNNLVLRDMNLEIKDIVSESQVIGQVTTVLGRSGVGKTQLFKIIAGLMKPTTGKVLVGHPLVPVEPGKVGMVLQTYPLFKHYTLLNNLKLVCSDMARIEAYLTEFDIVDHKDKYPSQLSGGQRQRTAIVQQLLSSEFFTLLDEPFSGLDPVATEKLCRNIQKMANQDGKNTVLISTHILEPALAISDSVMMIGYDYSEDKCKIPGATIKYTYDLAANGMAWRPDIRKDPQFHKLVEDIRDLFNQL